jgi:aspartyl-tRNA(Asn)/glutamyl-tRNA(Gln) amidotransferase subunit B
MRHKEKANDYRYFPEPDLQPIILNQKYIDSIKSQLPPLPNYLFKKFTKDYNLSEYDAKLITDEKEIALYFNELCNITHNYKAAANLINGVIKSYLNENALSIKDLPITQEQISSIINLLDDGKISTTIANTKIFPILIKSDKLADEIAQEKNWIQESDNNKITEYIKLAINKYPEKVIEYKNGKKGLIGLFMGEIMKLSRGKVDPKKANEALLNELNK